MRLPAVVTDPAGVRAMLAGSDAALMAPARDERAYTDAVRAMAALPAAERERRGASALALVEERYSLRAVVDQLEATYADALSRRRS